MADNGDGGAAGQETPGDGRPAPEAKTEWTASDQRGPLSAAESEEGHAQPLAGDPDDIGGAIPQAAASSEEPSPPHEVSHAAAPPPAPARRSVVPILAGLVVGAIIGAGSAALVYEYNQGSSAADPRIAEIGARVDALEKRPDPAASIDALKASVAALDAKVQAAGKTADAPAKPFDPTPLQSQVNALQAKVDAVQKQASAGSLEPKVAALAAAVETLRQQADTAKGLDGKVAALAATVDGVKTSTGALKTTVDGLETQGATAQSGIAALQADQKQLAGKITSAPALAVVADSLVDAIAHGQPYGGQVDALASLGADPAKLAVLRENADKGVPSAQALAAKFAPLADPITATAYRVPADAGLMDRLKSGMMSMVSVRRADAPVGDDVGSRVSRIESDLAHDDVAGAYATWDGLPADAKARSESWGALAKTQVEAMAAARGLQQQAIVSLGAKKS